MRYRNRFIEPRDDLLKLQVNGADIIEYLKSQADLYDLTYAEFITSIGQAP